MSNSLRPRGPHSPPGSSVHGISQARIWSGLPFPSPGDLPDSGIKPAFLGLAGGFFTINIAILLTFTINGTPLQYSGLENPMDGGAWWAAVHGVAKSRTRLRDFTFTFHFHALEKEMTTHSSILT